MRKHDDITKIASCLCGFPDDGRKNRSREKDRSAELRPIPDGGVPCKG